MDFRRRIPEVPALCAHRGDPTGFCPVAKLGPVDSEDERRLGRRQQLLFHQGSMKVPIRPSGSLEAATCLDAHWSPVEIGPPGA